MKVKLKNVGMLDEAEFEVGDLTLICGENNTGKTYATYSLYGYLDFVCNNSAHLIFDVIQTLDKNSELVTLNDYEMQIENIEKIFNDLSIFIREHYKSKLVEILAGKEGDFNDSTFKDDMLEIFFDIMIKKANNEEKQKKTFEFFSHSQVFELVSIDTNKILLSYKKSKDSSAEQMKNDTYIKKQELFVALILYIYKLIYRKPFILSAERTGASIFYKELDVNKNEIVEEISKANGKNIEETVYNLFNTRYSRYPKPVKDNIYFIRSIDETEKRISFIQKEKNELHSNILALLYTLVGGKYIVGESGIEFAPGAKQRITKKGKISIQRASSSVRSLLMLNYYILNVAQKGDILMIDEPELNLHPKNQILVARLLTLLVNAGIKVFITTHSDYIIRELSNCIMLNNLSDEQIAKFKKQDYTKELKLEAQKVKAYLAKYDKGKNILKPVKIEQNRGIFMETFDEPIDSQNENQGNIFEEVLRNEK